MDDFTRHMTPPTMRYANIKYCEIENGEDTGMSLFVQGCQRHCKGCFNESTWRFDGGMEWTDEIEDRFVRASKRNFIHRVSILGGEPLDEQNIFAVAKLLRRIREECPDRTVWLYTGYLFSEVPEMIKKLCDYIVDGPFEISKRNISLKYRGSENQIIYDCKTNKPATKWM